MATSPVHVPEDGGPCGPVGTLEAELMAEQVMRTHNLEPSSVHRPRNPLGDAVRDFDSMRRSAELRRSVERARQSVESAPSAEAGLRKQCMNAAAAPRFQPDDEWISIRFMPKRRCTCPCACGERDEAVTN